MTGDLPVSASKVIPCQVILIIVAFVVGSSTGVFILVGVLQVRIVSGFEYVPMPTPLIAAT